MKQYLNVVTAYIIMFTLIVLVGIFQSWSQALSILNYCLISAVMTIGANIQWGYAGLINFGIMGYTALGGLAVVLVSVAPVPEAWKAGGINMIGSLGIIVAMIFSIRYVLKKINKSKKRNYLIAGIIVIGLLAQWIAWRMKIPAIFPLIILGLIMGPLSTLFLDEKWIDPENIFAGKTMYYFVSLSVGVILFEGGLTLKFKEVRQLAGVVRNLLIVGPIVMGIGGALAAHYFLDMDYRVGLLFGSLIIVTGPTVIAPILRSVRPKKNISTILEK